MHVEIVTKDDLRDLEDKLNRIIELISGAKRDEPKDWLRSLDVKRILKCSDATLKNYRDSGKLPYSKVEGTYYYPADGLKAMLRGIDTINSHIKKD